MNTDNTDFDAQAEQVTSAGGRIGRVFAYKGAELKPFSYTHRMAYARLSFESMSQLEADILLVFLLHKEAREVDKIRGEEATNFRIAANEWAETQADDATIMASAADVRGDLKQAESVEAVGGAKGGNA